jgi:hypothetical protein
MMHFNRLSNRSSSPAHADDPVSTGLGIRHEVS